MQKVFTKPQATYQKKKRNVEEELLQSFQQTYFLYQVYPYTTRILLIGIDRHITFIGIF